jgi:endonuclease/exonuclease/phosphatase family metal-dependent hydrolase
MKWRDMRVLTWNLYHGRSKPPAGRSLLNDFARALDGWAWDVALLQEVPPWWAPLLARGCGACERSVLTSRNGWLAARRAVSARDPDLLKANGGGANTILVRGAITDHRTLRLCRTPERRAAHAVALADGTWVVNLHASTHPKTQTRRDVGRALAAAYEWSAGRPLVFGGDLNVVRPSVPGLEHVAGHHVDHLYARGLDADGPAEVLACGPLSDHRPLACTVR